MSRDALAVLQLKLNCCYWGHGRIHALSPASDLALFSTWRRCR